MELRHLRYFIAVAELENVSRAAVRLHVSQPALSRQVRDLEEELGFELLERHARSVRLTDAGRVFLQEARAVLARVEQAVQSARAAGGSGEIHVGYAPSLTARLLPRTLRAFQAAFPRVVVRLHDLSTGEMLARLRDESLQIALMVRPPRSLGRGVQFRELMRDALRLAVSAGHPLARRRLVTVAEASRLPLIAYSRGDYPEYHDGLQSLFGRATRLKIAEEHDSVTSLVAAVEAGGGAAVVADSIGCIAGRRLKLLPLSPNPDPFVIGAAWLGDEPKPLAAEFLRCAESSAQGH